MNCENYVYLFLHYFSPRFLNIILLALLIFLCFSMSWMAFCILNDMDELWKTLCCVMITFDFEIQFSELDFMNFYYKHQISSLLFILNQYLCFSYYFEDFLFIFISFFIRIHFFNSDVNWCLSFQILIQEKEGFSMYSL